MIYLFLQFRAYMRAMMTQTGNLRKLVSHSRAKALGYRYNGRLRGLL
jgi:hypothetical protein